MSYFQGKEPFSPKGKGFKPRGKQPESILQRDIVKALNQTGLGYFFRIRNGATWDPRAGLFRSNTTDKGIPDVHGFKKNSQACFIEVKYLEKVEKKEKLIWNVKIELEQKEWLLRAYLSGCLAGVAFNIEDALAIAMDDKKRYPRHPRTYCFLPLADQERKAEEYKKAKGILTVERQDPLKAQITHAMPPDEEDWEKL